MPWARLDDDLIGHPKFNELLMEPEGWAAFGFWSAMLVWANKHTRKPGKTPGLLKRADVHAMDRANAGRFAGLLVKVGFWELRGDDWYIHDFETYLPSERKLAAQKANASKGGLAKAAKAKLATGQNSVPTGQETLATGLPNSAHALGTGKGSSKELQVVEPSVARARNSRGTRLPDPYPITDEMREWGRARVPHVNAKLEHEKFCNFWWSKSGQGATKIDWFKTWQNWMLSAAEKTGRPVQDSLPVDPRAEHMMRR